MYDISFIYLFRFAFKYSTFLQIFNISFPPRKNKKCVHFWIEALKNNCKKKYSLNYSVFISEIKDHVSGFTNLFVFYRLNKI